METTWSPKTATISFIVVRCLGGEEENIYPRRIRLVILFSNAEIMMGAYSLMFGKSIYGATSVKMLLHQLWGSERVKQHAGPQYNHRRTNLRIFGTILVVVIYFKCV